MMKKKIIGKNAQAYFDSGYNCAESVSLAVVEAFSPEDSEMFPRIATPFGGGGAGSHQEMCGALAGGFMAIGAVLGRKDKISGSEAKMAAGEFRDSFIETVGATQCEAILDQFGLQHNSEKCSELVRKSAELCASLLIKRGFQPRL